MVGCCDFSGKVPAIGCVDNVLDGYFQSTYIVSDLHSTVIPIVDRDKANAQQREDIDGEICFVADQMYSVEIDGVAYENVNIFYLNDPNYQNWAEQTVTVRAAAVSKSGEKFMLDLQYIVSDDVCVSTPFSEYHFPAEWADRLLIKHSYSDSDYTIAFYADMDAGQEYLFSIVMGENDGTPIGKLTDDMDAVTMVYLNSREDNFEGYSQTEQDYLYSMMEGINYLFDELAKNPQFSDEF